MPRNLTIQLDEETIRLAKVAAARRGMSMRGWVTRQIEEVALKDEAYEQAKRSAFALMDKGFDLGGPPYPKRDTLYDR